MCLLYCPKCVVQQYYKCTVLPITHRGRAVRCASCWIVYATWWPCWNKYHYIDTKNLKSCSQDIIGDIIVCWL